MKEKSNKSNGVFIALIKAIKKARIDLEITEAEMAQGMGITQKKLALLESGEIRFSSKFEIDLLRFLRNKNFELMKLNEIELLFRKYSNPASEVWLARDLTPGHHSLLLTLSLLNLTDEEVRKIDIFLKDIKENKNSHEDCFL